MNSKVHFEVVRGAEGFTAVGAVLYPPAAHSLPGVKRRHGGGCGQAVLSWKSEVTADVRNHDKSFN